ncbi:MAG: serine protease [Rhodospirillaceae bacterium]|nr:MAG: serine protease [Rhodospirillaceae bacterium]
MHVNLITRRLLVLPLMMVFTVALFGTSSVYAKGAPESFADLAEELLPAVVNISTTQLIEGNSSRQPNMPQFPPGSPFEDFFKDFFDKNGQGNGNGQKSKKRKATSLGSGFIIDYRKNGDAYVVTNNHVIQDADEVFVLLNDDTRMKATIVGRDTKTDLAVLKVHTDRKLPSVSFGDSKKTRVGDWILAIGNPFGLGGTVTAGIVSARGRDINAGPYDDFIQTDASINRGNSGGPMFNMDGDVVGINTAIFSPTGGSVGIGFAIPSSTAAPVIRQLINNGQVQRGWLGVHIQVVTKSIAEALGLKKTEGALVASVVDGGPADHAGLMARDVILEFDGKRVTEMRKLPRIVAATEVGRSVKVKVWRDGSMATLKVTIEKLDDDEAVVAAQQKNPKKSLSKPKVVSELGLTLATITPDIRDRFELPAGVEGVIIADVDPNGPAFEEGVRPGDVVTEISQQKINTPLEAERLVKDAVAQGKRSVLLLIEGQSGFRFVAVRLK